MLQEDLSRLLAPSGPAPDAAAIPPEASIRSTGAGSFGAGLFGAATPSSALHSATHALLRVTNVEEAVAVVANLVAQLGGRLVPGHSAPADALRIDCSLGYGEVRFPTAENPATLLTLRELLPPFLDDVQLALERFATAQVSELVDRSTALLTAEAGARLLPRLTDGDAVVAMGLMGLHQGRPTFGRGDGEADVVEFARVLLQVGRAEDAFIRCRRGGEFLALLRQPGEEGVIRFVERVLPAWRKVRRHPVEVAAAQVRVRTSGTTAADAALEAMRDIVEGRPTRFVDLQQPAVPLAGF